MPCPCSTSRQCLMSNGPTIVRGHFAIPRPARLPKHDTWYHSTLAVHMITGNKTLISHSGFQSLEALLGSFPLDIRPHSNINMGYSYGSTIIVDEKNPYHMVEILPISFYHGKYYWYASKSNEVLRLFILALSVIGYSWYGYLLHFTYFHIQALLPLHVHHSRTLL